MLQVLLSILGILLTIFFVIGTHEAAHFITARLLKVKVLRFSIGFGKSLARWYDKKGTEYVLALIPLGGYVKMLDEREGDVAPEEVHLAFNRQPFYKKFLIVLAGPAANIFCAFILYWLIFMIGFVNIRPIIGEVAPGSIAANGGLKMKQEIIRVDDRKTSNWTSVLFRILAHAGNQDQLKVETRDPASNKTQTHLLDLTAWDMDELSPDPLNSLGIKPYEPVVPLVIGVIAEASPAAASPLKTGDLIIALDKKKVNDWSQVLNATLNHPGETIRFTVERQGKQITFPVNIGYKRNLLFQKYGYLGIGPDFTWPENMMHKIQYGPIQALGAAGQQIIDFTYFNLLLFGKMVTGKLSLQSLGGPITIFETAGTALNYGLLSFLGFLAFLSITIGIINILPIPGLDGGHLVIQTVEFLIQRTVPERIIIFLYYMGFTLILFVLIQALVNDLLRLM
ncbi:RIP metalloprotease RseP [Aquicella lusitana]|uniref:Zinc metalloprotease n=1 Tax=Aquicella lusitana TaxID=254246 RepID=A0A370GGP6_9COXI|nr:RIP metalloprotease RseP [Aquicella lusitana]RDI42847.1 site-2 protease [Aquicella lusitana]VVC73090.1 Regulator of sigma-E protease RseP [Aquicella lusitana]